MANRTLSLSSSSRTPQSGKDLRFEVLSLILFALAAFSLAALFSYHPRDPSFFSRVSDPNGLVIGNLCGKIGASLAAIFLQMFGMGGFLLPFALLFVAVTVYEKEGWSKVFAVLAGMAVSALAVTVFLSLQWKFVRFAGTSLLTGGILGAWISNFLSDYLNYLGATIVSLLVFGVSLVLCTPIRLARIMGQVTKLTFYLSIHVLKVFGAYCLYLLGLVLQRSAEGIASRWKEFRENKKETGAVDPIFKENVIEVEFTPTPAPEAKAPTEMKFEGPQITPFQVEPTAEESPKKDVKRPAKMGPWKLPLIDFLRKVPKLTSSFDREVLIQNSTILTRKLADFGVVGEVTQVRPGPVITLYEFKPGPGIKVSKISALSNDLSMALSAKSVRILAPLPGKSVVGIEIPSEQREKVFLREFLQDPDFYGDRYTIPVVMGKDIGGQTVISDLAKMPHLLCAGQTGSGKSVFMNALICSLLYRFNPDELRMILVDPKFIEFRAFQDIPHLLLPVVDEPREAAVALKWAVREMQRRYRILAKIGAKNLAQYNQKVQEMGPDVIRDLLLSESEMDEGSSKGEGADWIEAFEPDESGEPKIGKLPFIVIIIDELADLVMIARKEVEISVNRIAQKARAAGLHLVVATQRPSTDVVTGLIKVNLPSRVSFHLASYIDSKTILDRSGAECLLGEGDMLYIPPGGGSLVRLQGAYVEDDEIHKITSFLKAQGKPHYREEILVDDESSGDDDHGEELDVLYHEAVDLIRKSGQASASYLQRHLGVGYNRAAKMIERMEEQGIVGPSQGSKAREVI